MRRRLAIFCSLLVPGSGLILLRREWLGLAAAVLFGLLGQVALIGVLIVPGTIPVGVTAAAAAGAVFVWLGSQWQLWVRLRVSDGPALQRELAALRQQAQNAADRNDYAEAQQLLRLALTLNDEDPECNAQWAHLMTLMGRFPQAKRAWHRVLRLDHDQQNRRTAQEALAALPD